MTRFTILWGQICCIGIGLCIGLFVGLLFAVPLATFLIFYADIDVDRVPEQVEAARERVYEAVAREERVRFALQEYDRFALRVIDAVDEGAIQGLREDLERFSLLAHDWASDARLAALPLVSEVDALLGYPRKKSARNLPD